MAFSMQSARKSMTLEREYKARIEDVWELWTTKAGIESWWGPDGFDVQVLDLDLRPGGAVVYRMRAIGSDQIDFLRKAGMAVVTEHRVTYLEVEPLRRLVFKNTADFVPGVPAYDFSTAIDFEVHEGRVRMVLTCDAMHDAHWTEMALKGREMELARLEKVLAARTG